MSRHSAGSITHSATMTTGCGVPCSTPPMSAGSPRIGQSAATPPTSGTCPCIKSDMSKSANVAGLPADEVERIVAAAHPDPFAVLGLHEAGGKMVVRSFVPGAERLEVIAPDSDTILAALTRLNSHGVFDATVPHTGRSAYRLRAPLAGRNGVLEGTSGLRPDIGDCQP